MDAPRENEHLEFKEAKHQFDVMKLFRYCVAIANEGGGKLILGVSNRIPRKVVGSEAFRNTANIAEKIFIKLRFRVDVEEIAHPDGRVVLFRIPSRPKGTAYQLEGSYLMRSTEDTVSMSEDRLRQIFEEGKPDWLLHPAKENCTADDVVRLLDTQGYFDLLKLTYPTTREVVLERFEQAKLIQKKSGSWIITNLGAILFAKKIDDFDSLSRKTPRVIVYEGTSKLKTRLDKFGARGYAVGFEGLLEFINGQIPTNEIIQLALRKEKKMFPEIAIRELVANALIHQDLNESGPILIEIYSDRMEITNPGRPFIPTDRFIDEYQSRNERLADLMRRFGICEEKGSGVDKVVNATEVYQLPAPDFRVGERHTTVVLFAHKPFEDMDRKDRIRACYQHCCLRYVMNERMTNQSLRERFKLSVNKITTVSQLIADTLDVNLIKLDDATTVSKRYARYQPFWA
ncbi:MAG: putative DNA binding domain-containing protein [Candidatus Omnitrophica bacterium]|nr:putative DNA binding domain-containing protein [Candidatus Omnitrophota bacterium]